MSPLETHAKAIAEQAHTGQMYGDRPYIEHCAEVVEVLKEFELGRYPALLAAGWLHDVLEDCTGWTERWLADELGNQVAARLVANVTEEPGLNRYERHLLTFPKIRRDPRSVALKLADRIANVRAAMKYGDSRLEMYVKEHPLFRAALLSYDNEDMWTCLDALIVSARPA